MSMLSCRCYRINVIMLMLSCQCYHVNVINVNEIIFYETLSVNWHSPVGWSRRHCINTRSKYTEVEKITKISENICINLLWSGWLAFLPGLDSHLGMTWHMSDYAWTLISVSWVDFDSNVTFESQCRVLCWCQSHEFIYLFIYQAFLNATYAMPIHTVANLTWFKQKKFMLKVNRFLNKVNKQHITQHHSTTFHINTTSFIDQSPHPFIYLFQSRLVQIWIWITPTRATLTR